MDDGHGHCLGVGGSRVDNPFGGAKGCEKHKERREEGNKEAHFGGV